jgi:putative ABC transport system permease protein
MPGLRGAAVSKLLSDIRVGLRSLLLHPGVTAVAIVTLALGVGVSSAAFSIVSGTVLNPTPWRDAEELVFLWERDRTRDEVTRPLPYARFRDVQAQASSLEGIGAARGFGFVLTDRDEVETVPGAYVSPELFSLLGLRMALGRSLEPGDAAAEAPRVVVLAHSLWRTRFDADPEILGRQIEIERQPFTVVGVLDADVWFPNPGTLILTPLRPTPEESADRTLRSYIALARLRDGADREQLATELRLISERLTEEHPDTDSARWPLHAQTISEGMYGGGAGIAIALVAGALGFLLLIACANLTGLFLTRATARQREIAVRAAVGASRGQIVAQLLTENAILAIVAVPLALGVSRITLAYILSRIPPQVTGMDQIFRFDLPVWLFAAGVAIFTVLLFGTMPAIRASRIDLTAALKEGGDRGAAGGRSQKLRSLLAVGQLALSVVMLVVASLLGQSFARLVNADTGFDMTNLLYAPIGLPDTRYPEPAQRASFVERLTERLEQVPGVVHVGFSDSAVSAGGGPTREYEIASRRDGEGAPKREARLTAGTPGYVSALGLTLIEGRYLTEEDDAQGRRVALVSELFVRTSFAEGESAVGDAIVLNDETRLEIVGVVQNVVQVGLDATQRAQIYIPYAQQPSPFMQLVARTSVDPLSLGPTVRAAIAELDPLIPVVRLTTALRERALNNWPIGLFASILGLLGGVGLTMAALGIYSVIRYSTQQRMRELGIRAALGAEPRSLLLLVMRQTWLLTATGLLLGLGLSTFVTRYLGTLVYDVGTFDPATLAGPAALLTAASLLAGALPAARAARVDPMIALGAE